MHVAGAATGVDFEASDDRPPPPPYVFTSRFRYFSLTRNRFYSLVAALTWTAATGLGQAICGFTGRRHPRSTRREREALIDFGLLSSIRQVNPAIGRLDDRPRLPPAWSAA